MAVDMTNHFTKSFSSSTQGLYNMILKIAKVDPALFPKIILPTDQVGGVTKKAAQELGLLEGTPVFGGCGDIPAIAVGSGCSEPGDTHAYLGSSGWFSSTVHCKEAFLSTSPFSIEYDLLLFGFQAIGLAFDWAIHQFYAAECESMGAAVYDFVEKECASIAPGSDGLLSTHWLYGERPPFFSDRARGAFININHTHTRAHMVNAVMESVCYSMRLSLDALRKGTRREVNALRAVGGCATSNHWMQMLADVLGIVVEVPRNPRHAGAVGAAYCALIGLGLCSDFNEAKARIVIEKRYQPSPDTSAAYHKASHAYRLAFHALDGVCKALQ